jgi:site-specific DNA-methyltransferase (adenine-specific)
MRVESNLPSKIEDLAQFVLVGRDKLAMVRAGIKALDKLDVAEGVRQQKKEEAQMLAEALLDAEVKIGEILARMPKASGGDRKSEVFKSDNAVVFDSPKPTIETKQEAIAKLGFDKKQAERFQTLAANKEIVEQIKQEARENDDLATRTAVLQVVKERDKSEQLKQAQFEKTATMNAAIETKPLVMLSDCKDYLQTIDNESIDLIITDPPYLTEFNTTDFKNFVDNWLFSLLDKLKSTGRAYICTGAYPDEIAIYLEAFMKTDFIIDAPLVWTYRNTLGQTPKMKYNLNYQFVWHLYRPSSNPLDTSITNEMFSVQDINAPDGRLGNRYHTWQKPDELANRIVRHASKKGDTVIDIFACTGTFLLSAAKANRIAIGCELSEENIKIAESRGCRIG